MATSSPPPSRRDSAAPADRISAAGRSGIGGAALHGPNQVGLQITQGGAAGVQVMPGPRAVRAEPPGRRALVHRLGDEPAQLSLLAWIGDADQELDPPVQVPVHEVGAADPDLTGRVPLAAAEPVDPRVLQETADDAADPDRLGHAGDARPQGAAPAAPQVDGHARLGRPVQRVDGRLVDDRVAFHLDARWPALPGAPGPVLALLDPAR